MSDIKLSKAKFTTYQIIVLAILALMQFMAILDFMIISPIGDILIKTLDILASVGVPSHSQAHINHSCEPPSGLRPPANHCNVSVLVPLVGDQTAVSTGGIMAL
jgi:hypothetical protein